VRSSSARSRTRWFVAVLAATTFGGTDELGALLDAFQSRYERVVDFRTRFEQESHVVSLDRTETSRGTFLYRRPGRFRWEVEEPAASLLVADGETLRMYDPEEGVLQIAPMTAGGISQTALGFLFGEADLRRSFDVEPIAASIGDPPGARLRLTPLSDASFERMDVRIDGETLRVAEVVILDLLGNRTRLAFTESEENVGLEERVFTIRVPDDTEVIDLRK
jgi:outer membrane lipoprotein carrier protein